MISQSSEERKRIPIHNWVQVAGSWEVAETECRYLVPDPSDRPNPSVQPYGLLLSDCRRQDIEVTLTMRIEGEDVLGSSAGMVVGFRPEPLAYGTVTLGGHDRAYAIDEFSADVGWRMIAGTGSVRNLVANTDYSLRVVQVGQRIVVEVNGVRVLEQVLPRPLPDNQLGLFAYGNRVVRFRDVKVHASRPKVFVAMRFCEPFDTLYQVVIERVLKQEDLDPIRADEITGPGVIFQDIQREIAEAGAVIAEITAPDRNENVFYELGYAHALNKPTILLAERGRELPFDIRSYRVIFYDNSIGGNPEVKRQLRSHLRAIMEKL